MKIKQSHDQTADASGPASDTRQQPDGEAAECRRQDFLIYRDVFGSWRWEYRQADGHYIDSRSGYASSEECLAAAERSLAERIRVHGA